MGWGGEGFCFIKCCVFFSVVSKPFVRYAYEHRRFTILFHRRGRKEFHTRKVYKQFPINLLVEVCVCVCGGGVMNSVALSFKSS